MRFLVTGCCGFIGSNFTTMASYLQHKVLGLDKLTYAADPENLEPLSSNIELRLNEHGDITNKRAVFDAVDEFKPDVIVNFAAETHVDNSIEDSAEFIRSNVLGVHNLLEAVRTRPNVRLLQISTDEVYGHLGPEDPAFRPESPLRPRNPYSATKAAADHLVTAYASTYDMVDRLRIVRCVNNYGPHQHREKMIPTIIRCLLAGEPVPVYGRGENVREWIFVEDFCADLLRLCGANPDDVDENGWGIGSAFINTIGSGVEMKNVDLVQTIAGVLRKINGHEETRTLIEFVKDRKGHDHRYAMAESRTFNGHTGYTSFYTAMKKTIEWYIEKQKGESA